MCVPRYLSVWPPCRGVVPWAWPPPRRNRWRLQWEALLKSEWSGVGGFVPCVVSPARFYKVFLCFFSSLPLPLSPYPFTSFFTLPNCCPPRLDNCRYSDTRVFWLPPCVLQHHQPIHPCFVCWNALLQFSSKACARRCSRLAAYGPPRSLLESVAATVFTREMCLFD